MQLAYGQNRINEFIKNCIANQWMVSKIDINNQVDIYNLAEEEINFE